VKRKVLLFDGVTAFSKVKIFSLWDRVEEGIDFVGNSLKRDFRLFGNEAFILEKRLVDFPRRFWGFGRKFEISRSVLRICLASSSFFEHNSLFVILIPLLSSIFNFHLLFACSRLLFCGEELFSYGKLSKNYILEPCTEILLF